MIEQIEKIKAQGYDPAKVQAANDLIAWRMRCLDAIQQWEKHATCLESVVNTFAYMNVVEDAKIRQGKHDVLIMRSIAALIWRTWTIPVLGFIDHSEPIPFDPYISTKEPQP